MGRDVSIVISARDMYSPAVNSMRASNQHFNKDLEESRRQIDAVIKKQDDLKESIASLKKSMIDQSKIVSDARKEYKKLEDDVSGTKYENAIKEQERLKNELSLVSKASSDARKELNGLYTDQNRASNRASGAETGLAASLAKAGIFKMVGDSASEFAKVGISSAFGDATGNAISTTLSGAITGAAMGSIAGPLGTAIGAVVGAAAGGITAATQAFEKRDDAFKSTRQELIENSLAQQNSDISDGIAIAAKRQMDETAFSAAFNKNYDNLSPEQYKSLYMRGIDRYNYGSMASKGFLGELRAMDLTNPFSYDDLTGLSRTLLNYRLDKDTVKGLLNSIGDAGAFAGLGVDDMTMVAKTIGQLTQTATATKQDINKFTDRSIPAVEYLAQAKGLQEEDIYDLMSKGGITGKEAAEIIIEYLANDPQFKGMAAKQAETYSGKLSVISGLEDNLKAAYGEGFMKERSVGLSEQEAFLSGEEMKQREEVNRYIGQWNASLENLKEDMQRRMELAVLNNDMSQISSIEGISNDLKNQLLSDATTLASDYQRAMADEDGTKLGEIFASAQIKAQAAYNASEGAQQLVEMQRSLIEQTSKTLAVDENTYLAGHRIGEAYSKGIIDAIRESNAFNPIPGGLTGGATGFSNWGTLKDIGKPESPPGNAWGIPYVPRDNYITRLHEGERVLTASEARVRDKSVPPFAINIPSMVIREEADVYRVAQTIAAELKKAQMISI